MINFFIGLIVGIILTCLGFAIEIGKDKRKLVWMDENYELHPVKKIRKRNGDNSIK